MGVAPRARRPTLDLWFLCEPIGVDRYRDMTMIDVTLLPMPFSNGRMPMECALTP